MCDTFCLGVKQRLAGPAILERARPRCRLEIAGGSVDAQLRDGRPGKLSLRDVVPDPASAAVALAAIGHPRVIDSLGQIAVVDGASQGLIVIDDLAGVTVARAPYF